MVFSEKDVRIVLVRPRNPLNIGAAARAMMNFGFQDLVLVAPHEPVWQESRAALKAEKLLATTRALPHLLEAIEDRTLVLGTSSLARRKPSQPVVSLDQLPAWCKRRRQPDRVAVLFGPEKTGLSNADLSYCRAIVRIPTAQQCPSMNLGQAVAVCCYELRRLVDIRNRGAKQKAPRATLGEVTRLVDQVERVLWEAEQPPPGRESPRQIRLRQMLLRWPVSSQDVTLLLGILRNLSWQLRHKP